MGSLQGDDRVGCQGADVDFTTITHHSPLDVIVQARQTCAECPALGACLTYLETTEVAGLAGGMLPRQRRRWRLRNGYVTEDVGLAQVSEVHELHGAILDGLGVRAGPHPTPEVIDLVRRLTVAGASAEEIVARVNDPRLTHRTIKYIRIRYLDDARTNARRVRYATESAAAAHRRAVREWAGGVGLEVPRDPSRRLPVAVMRAYRDAHTESA